MRTSETEQAPEAARQYLSFFLGDEEYGVGILESREIIQYQPVTPVPSMPASVRGVINLRGNVVPVVDLAVLFGLPPRPTTRWTCVVVVEASLAHGAREQPIAFVVDRVSQVVELGAADIEPAPAFGTQIAPQYLAGMGKVGRLFILLLDLDRLVASLELERGRAGLVEAVAPVAPVREA